VTATWTQQT